MQVAAGSGGEWRAPRAAAPHADAVAHRPPMKLAGYLYGQPGARRKWRHGDQGRQTDYSRVLPALNADAVAWNELMSTGLAAY
jgi:hypothetical protein